MNAGKSALRRVPSLKALQAFDAAARRASFAEAALELHVTTSAISHQIRFLEEEIGIELFHRSSRSVTLSDAGLRYSRDVAEAFNLIESATRGIERSGKSDTLTVQADPSFARQWLLPRIGRFNKANESIELRLSASTQPIDLAAGSIDIEIRYGRTVPSSGIVVLPLPDEAIIVVCAPQVASDCHHPIVEPADLVHHILIHSETSPLSWRAWARDNGDIPLELGRGPRLDRAFMAIGAAVDGLGVCLESSILVQRELQTGQLVAPFGVAATAVHCHSLCMLRSKQNVPKVKAFRDWLTAELVASNQSTVEVHS